MQTPQTNPLLSLSPLDGRYKAKCEELSPFFSEYGLIFYRLRVEVEWLKTLCSCPKLVELSAFKSSDLQSLDSIIDEFSLEDAQRVKDIEKITNHDVKAVEYFLKEKLEKNADFKPLTEFIHFACTSEDINNLAYALMIKDSRDKVLLPVMREILERVSALARSYSKQPMLSRTHGQPASFI